MGSSIRSRNSLSWWVLWFLAQAVSIALTSEAGRSGWGWLWISLAQTPLFALVYRAPSFHHALSVGLGQAALFVLTVFSWLTEGAQAFFEISFWRASLLTLSLSPFFEPQFIVGSAFRFWSGQRRWRSAFGLRLAPVLVFVLGETLLPRFLADSISFPLLGQLQFAQAADLGGTAVLTFLVYVLAEWFWLLLDTRARREQADAFRVWSVFSVLLLGATFLYGELRLRELRGLTANSTRSLQVGVVQPHFSALERRAAAEQVDGVTEKRVSRFLELSDKVIQLNPHLDWILWPETAVQSRYLEPATASESRAVERLEGWIFRSKVPVVFGAFEQNDQGLFNSIHVLTEIRGDDGASDVSVALYRKSLLFPLGERALEFLPSKWFATPHKSVLFEPGPGPRLLTLPGRSGRVRVNPVVCYEIGFPDYVGAGARLGSELILNATNLGWFENRLAGHYHFMSARFRSIETRLPQVVASESGISGVILPDGSIAHLTPQGVADFFVAKVPLFQPPKTLFLLWGASGFARLCGILLFCLLVWEFRAFRLRQSS